MNHFYITLPSDRSANYYPKNIVAHFTTRPPHRIQLDGDYEVGRSEIIYPYSWFNFSNGDEEIYTYFLKDDTRCVKSIFESGQFPADNILVNSMNDEIAD